MKVVRKNITDFVRSSGKRYWSEVKPPQDKHPLSMPNLEDFGKSWIEVQLPTKYKCFGVDGILVVDEISFSHSPGDKNFENCDWYLAAFSYLSGVTEQLQEARHGSINSYQKFLKVPSICFEYAWANRILLLMRRLAADELGVTENALFGKLPPPEFILTHDVDAVAKTAPIRIKQSLFELFNSVRFFFSANPWLSFHAIKRFVRILFRTPNYDHLNQVAEFEKKIGVRSTFFFHCRRKKRSTSKWFMDPGYFLTPEILEFIQTRNQEGFKFGIHPSFFSWKNPDEIRYERELFENTTNLYVDTIRQHWLRFSWKNTWKAQIQAGLKYDMTLGFNDSPGFRTGAALEYHPWSLHENSVLEILTCPLILMDSHLYSYQGFHDSQRKEVMQSWCPKL